MAAPHWSKAKESGSILGIRILLWVHRVFGYLGFRVILLPVMSYYYLSNNTARKSSKQYLAYLKPYLDTEQQRSLSSFKHFFMFGEMMLDKFLAWGGNFNRDNVVFETGQLVKQLDRSKKGGIIVVSHLGNTEVSNALGQQLPNIKLTLLVSTLHAEKFNSLMRNISSSPNIKILQVDNISPATAMMLSERIEQGEFIVIAGDRTPNNESQARVSIVDFLGHSAAMPQGAFMLASLLKCPVYLMFCLKQQSIYHIYVELFSECLLIPRKNRAQIIHQTVQSYAARLEYYCKKAPLQWFNFFPFWNKP